MEHNIYNTVFSEVLVFKTNISSDKEVEIVKQLFVSEKRITRWNVDRDDIDKVLRIECNNLYPDVVINLLCKSGFECQELPD